MREWIVTNGLGGYASLTYNNKNTRKFHGLLIASLKPPLKRWVYIANIYDKIKTNDKTIELKDIKPKFNFKYFPTFTYKIEDKIIKKTILMEYQKNTTILKYSILSKEPLTMIHQPIINSRHFYDVNSQRYLTFKQTIVDNGIYLKPDNNDKTAKIFLENSYYVPKFYWENLYYKKDHERNEAWIDNNIHIGDFHKSVDCESEYYILLSIENNIMNHPSQIFSRELRRKKQIIEKSKLPKEMEKLILSTDNFIVKNENSKSIIAGYHWFGDWGRDTLISLPGLTLITKRFDDAKLILQNFGDKCRNGLVPNMFSDRDSISSYNSVDASLWYIDRVYQYFKYTNDYKFLRKNWDVLNSIVMSYKNGTDFNIYMDNDYLINHDPGLTWMDVKINDYYPTPRNNKAVEIQALWYNALKIMDILSDICHKDNWYNKIAENVKNSFYSQYDKLYDVIDTKDLSLRPNMVFLVSLDYSMVDRLIQQKIVHDIQNKLLTVFGLRTLSKDDPNYKGTFFGNYNKDIAYHNGTVWTWLMGPFIKSFVKVNNNSKQARKYAFDNFLKSMLHIFGEHWDGSINEIFDGDPIYEPRGCINQAWSVAEILRSWVEDIENIKPQYEYKILSNKICV